MKECPFECPNFGGREIGEVCTSSWAKNRNEAMQDCQQVVAGRRSTREVVGRSGLYKRGGYVPNPDGDRVLPYTGRRTRKINPNL